MYLDEKAPPRLSGYLGLIPDGPAGTKATLHLMRALTRQYKKALPIRAKAAALVQHLPQKAYADQARTIFDFVRDNIRYLRDVAGVETLQTPVHTLQVQYGDCDDKSTLLAAMLESIGHPTRFAAIATQSPGVYTHVFVETVLGKKWIAADATEPHPFGWRPPKIVGVPMIVHN